MKILFTFVGGNGHLQPLVPIALAAEAAGHSVIFACSHTMRSVVEQAGFDALLFGNPAPPANTRPERSALRAPNIEREEHDLRENFVRRGARTRIPRLIEVCTTWQPDLIVCDEVDFGSMIAAEYLGIPHAAVVVIAAGSFIRPDVVAEPLDELRIEYGLAPDPELTMLSRYLVLVPVPPSYRDPAFPLPATAHALQPFVRIQDPPRRWMPTYDPSLPTIYFTLGTVFNLESGDLFSRVLAGLADVQANVIVTVGNHIGPGEFGAQPDHIQIAQYIPQLTLLPHCDLVISHGGSGTVIASLAHGLPLLLIPMGADQLHNASRCKALGVGEVLDALNATSDDIRETVMTMLGTTHYRQAARSLQAEIDALPAPSHAVSLLERLNRDKRPVVSL